MLQDSVNNFLKASLGAGGLFIFLLALACIVPFVFIWTVNSLAEAGGSSFYIPHSFFNYILALLFLVLVRGGSK